MTTPRPYEINVLDLPGGFAWEIIVDGEVIATDKRARYPYASDAHSAAKQWAYLHEQMGYEFRPNWWDTLGFEEEEESHCPTCGGKLTDAPR